ncbi:DUF5610 domain-containing protein [Aeromonas cavernicola]|uniref:DUF5610 domain-containing protein n=1 Tax=Aeromonas cavernicola TaxID=1006623 RepID=A0A2H9U336_9GAMM|nr:DUF5610 domain-containing protein [Aeromonas cavernicola]PJG58435.1 hypothetical protein CUC53_12470 [Aeromonas cavernicola]
MQIDGMGVAQPRGVGVTSKSPQQTQVQAQPKPAQSEDEVSLPQPPKWAQKLVLQTLQFSLELHGLSYKAPRMQEPIEEPEVVTPETLFDFQEVSDNVMQFVTGGLNAARANGKSDAELTEMMAQARRGIDMGFEDAKRQLGSLATDNEDIRVGIEQSYKLIQESMDEFEQEFFGQVPAPKTDADDIAAPLQNMLEIQTNSGSNVVLRFNDDAQTSQPEQTGNQFTLKSSQSFKFSVEGNVSSGDMSAIGDIVKGIDELLGHFFSGNFEELLEKAGKLNLDDSNLASFSMRIKQNLKISQAYQGANPLQETLQPMADYLPKLEQLQQRSDVILPRFQQQALLAAVLAARGQGNADDLSRFSSFNQRMLNAL